MAQEPRKPIVIAPRKRLASVESLAPRFFAEVLGMDYYRDVLITDQSILWDFVNDDDEMLHAVHRFREHYFCEPPGDGSMAIVEFLEFLRDRGIAAQFHGSGSSYGVMLRTQRRHPIGFTRFSPSLLLGAEPGRCSL